MLVQGCKYNRLKLVAQGKWIFSKLSRSKNLLAYVYANRIEIIKLDSNTRCTFYYKDIGCVEFSDNDDFSCITGSGNIIIIDLKSKSQIFSKSVDSPDAICAFWDNTTVLYSDHNISDGTVIYRVDINHKSVDRLMIYDSVIINRIHSLSNNCIFVGNYYPEQYNPFVACFDGRRITDVDLKSIQSFRFEYVDYNINTQQYLLKDLKKDYIFYIFNKDLCLEKKFVIDKKIIVFDYCWVNQDVVAVIGVESVMLYDVTKSKEILRLSNVITSSFDCINGIFSVYYLNGDAQLISVE